MSWLWLSNFYLKENSCFRKLWSFVRSICCSAGNLVRFVTHLLLFTAHHHHRHHIIIILIIIFIVLIILIGIIIFSVSSSPSHLTRPPQCKTRVQTNASGLSQLLIMTTIILTATIKMPSYMDVAPWCYKWLDGTGWCLGGVWYRAP